jgi:hypothetical protein
LIPYFPWPYPDEVLGSLLVRACRHTGLPFGQVVCELAGYADRAYVSFLLPQFLAELSRVTGLSPLTMLWDHTIFPYVVSFRSQIQVKRLERLLLSGQAHVSSTTRLVTKALPFRRCCTACIVEDVARYGESYWHRVHLLPGVHVCPVHKLPLIVTGISTRRGDGQEAAHWVYDLPQEVVGQPAELPLSAEHLLALAQCSCQLLGRERSSRPGWASAYRRTAKAKGYAAPRGQISSLVLARDLHAFYGTSLLEEVHCSYMPLDRRSWPVLMLRAQPGIPFSPVKHVFLQTFLDHCPSGRKPDSPRLPGRRPEDFSGRDERCSQQARQAACAFEDWATVKKLLSQAGCWELYRHRRRSFPKTAAVVAEFKSSGRWSGRLSRTVNLGGDSGENNLDSNPNPP